jgi:hypothetical protein
LTTGPTFEGVLLARTPDHYRLMACKQIIDSDQSVNLDGEVEVPRERVLFIQRLGRAVS